MDTTMLPEEILFRWEDDFAEDFDFVDIQIEAMANILFNDQECNTILSYATRREQVKKMFNILVDGRKSLNIFIGVLSEKYGWLAEKLQTEINREEQSVEMELYRKQIDFLRSELPKHLDLNVKRTKHVSFAGRQYTQTSVIT